MITADMQTWKLFLHGPSAGAVSGKWTRGGALAADLRPCQIRAESPKRTYAARSRATARQGAAALRTRSSIAVYQSDKHNARSYSDQFANSSEDATGSKDGESKI
jgi:hypothetical protein